MFAGSPDVYDPGGISAVPSGVRFYRRLFSVVDNMVTVQDPEQPSRGGDGQPPRRTVGSLVRLGNRTFHRSHYELWIWNVSQAVRVDGSCPAEEPTGIISSLFVPTLRDATMTLSPYRSRPWVQRRQRQDSTLQQPPV
jgi:hypothetical protein